MHRHFFVSLTLIPALAPATLRAQPPRGGVAPVALGMPSSCIPRGRHLLLLAGGRVVMVIAQGNRVTMVETRPDPCLAAASIDSLTPGGSSARTLSEALGGRIAGVSVLRSSGVIGSGSRVRIRGGSGLLVPREPILIVDGVRVDGSQSSLGLDIGGQRPSRLDDIPLQDIERVTVLRGPASTALYGANGAGGVIVVTTRRGIDRPLEWDTWAETGIATDATDYPANSGTGPPTYGNITCTRAEAALGECTPGPLSQWNPLERASPFRTGLRWSAGARGAGTVAKLQYFASGSVVDDQGVLAPNDQRRWTGRLNVDAAPTRTLRLSLTGSHLASGTTLPVGDAFGVGALEAGLRGNTADDPANRGYFETAPGLVATLVTKQHLSRSLGAVTASWNPVRWLDVRGQVGRELVWRDDSRTFPMAVAFLDPNRDGPWRIEGSAGRDQHTTINGAVSAGYSVGPWIGAASTIGAERLTESLRTRDSVVGFFEDGSPGSFMRRTSLERRKTVGLFATQQIVWASRRVIDLGVRHDGGDRQRLLQGATYLSAAASWAISSEPFFAWTGRLGELRLRAAYGIGGDSRPARIALDGPLGLPPPLPGTDPEPVGSVLQPEKVSELETGAEWSPWAGRIHVAAAWYRQRSTNAIERGCCIGPLAYTDGASWRTRGVELTATAALLRTITTEWDTRVTFATFSNRYERGPSSSSAALDVFPFFGGARRRLVDGYPIAGTWGRPATGRDANGDGVIVPSGISIATDSVYVGSSVPTRQAGFATTLGLSRGRIKLSVQADYHGGFVSRNQTEQHRCGVSICDALYDPSASLADQTRAVLEFGQGTGFTERGDFVRLREVGVTWVLFPGVMNRHRAGELSLTVAGRNLATFTSYSGLDPETNSAGQASFGTTEFFTLPLPRTLLIRLAIQRCSFPSHPRCR